MKASAILTTFALLAPTVLAALLPACSTNSPTPCSCPNGTSYAQSATFGVIGAAVADFKDLTSDFFNTEWRGVTPFATQGPDNQPGLSIRSFSLPTAVGTYVFTEKLTELLVRPDGSFIEKYEQLCSTVPIEYHSGKGSFGGYWVTIEAESVFQNETAVIWSIYACETGHPRNFAKFHESALTNATNLLQAQGKILGGSLPPGSAQSF